MGTLSTTILTTEVTLTNSSTETEIILNTIDRFLDREVRPVAKELELSDTYPVKIVERMREIGLFGATIGTDYGGLGLSSAT